MKIHVLRVCHALRVPLSVIRLCPLTYFSALFNVVMSFVHYSILCQGSRSSGQIWLMTLWWDIYYVTKNNDKTMQSSWAILGGGTWWLSAMASVWCITIHHDQDCPTSNIHHYFCGQNSSFLSWPVRWSMIRPRSLWTIRGWVCGD